MSRKQTHSGAVGRAAVLQKKKKDDELTAGKSKARMSPNTGQQKDDRNCDTELVNSEEGNQRQLVENIGHSPRLSPQKCDLSLSNR